MKKIVVLTEEEYTEIERITNEHNEIKKQFKELQSTKNEFEKFKQLVAKMFLNEKGKFSYRERPIAGNKIFLNPEITAYCKR